MVEIEKLKQFVEYDPEAGILYWKPRYPENRANKIFNTRFSGKEAFGVKEKSGHKYGFINVLTRKRLSAHRVAWAIHYGQWPAKNLDHINGRPDDNRIGNLREATQSENMCNRSASPHNKSGYKGVSWAKRRNAWVAQIGKDKRTIFLGHYECPEEAHRAYCEASKILHGEFARTA